MAAEHTDTPILLLMIFPPPPYIRAPLATEVQADLGRTLDMFGMDMDFISGSRFGSSFIGTNVSTGSDIAVRHGFFAYEGHLLDSHRMWI